MSLDIQQPGGAVTSHPALAALDDCGLLERSQASYVRVEDLSRAHPVWLITLPDGRRLVIKSGHGNGAPDLAVECLIYRMTAWCQPLAAVLPRAVVVDEDRQLLVLADVNGSGNPGSLAERVGFPALLHPQDRTGPAISEAELARLTALIGVAVGRLHRATAGFPLPPAALPLVLRALGPSRTPTPEPLAAAVRTLSAHPQLVAAATEIAQRVSGCLVNQDMKWDNIVLSEMSDRPCPVLLDWEMAGLGDPAFDLGCLLAEHQVRSLDIAQLQESARALLGGYGDGAALRAAVRETFARRVVLAAGLRIAQLALEVAHTPASAQHDPTTRLAALAAAHLDHLPDLTTEVSRCLS